MDNNTNEPPELIRKLAALANHPNTPPAEAAAARRKLEKLLRDYDLTEEDLNSEARHLWCMEVEAHEKDLLTWVLSFILDSFDLTKWQVEIRKLRKSYDFRMRLTAADHVDVCACFEYYRKILRGDRRRIQEEAAELRREARELLKKAAVLSQGVKKLPEVLRMKYKLFPPYVIAKAEEADRQRKEGGGQSQAIQKAAKISPAERRRREKENAAYWAANRRASNNATWQKGDHLGGDFALEG